MERIGRSMKKELLKGLTEEQIAKIKACKSSEEVLALAKQEGIQLTDEQLTAVSGGCLLESTPEFTCPKCGSHEVYYAYINNYYDCVCKKCKHHWYD